MFCYCLVFSDAGVDMTSSIVASCGSGITACWITVAAWLLGKQVPVYVVCCLYNVTLIYIF